MCLPLHDGRRCFVGRYEFKPRANNDSVICESSIVAIFRSPVLESLIAARQAEHGGLQA